MTIIATVDHERAWTERVDGSRRLSGMGKPRAYVSFTKDFDVLEQLVNRTNRPWARVKPAVEKALRDAGVQFERIRWDQRAGCSCPCSPGFVLEGARFPNRYKDFYLSLSDDVQEAVDVARLEAVAGNPTLGPIAERAQAALASL